MPNVGPSKENGYFLLKRADFPDSFRVCVYAQSCLTLYRLLCPWDFPGKNTLAGGHFQFEGIFLTQGFELESLVLPVLAARFFTIAPPGDDFRDGFLKAGWGRGSQGPCASQLHPSFWLLVVRSSGANIINLLIPAHMGFCGQHSISFFQLVRVLVSAKQLKDILRTIIYSSGGGTKGPWLCFMAKLLLFCLA